MPCRLCLKDRDLRDSHIIPEFLYRPGYDEKGRMEILRRTSPHTRYIQKGFREKLLCSDCEGLFANRYEDYFAKLWYIQKPIPRSTNLELIELNGIDYSLFKLFHLSVLWRASVSTLEQFSRVQLGPHTERVRAMLINEDPGLASEFQVFAAVVLFPGTREVLEGIISSPTAQRFEGRRIYMFLFGGCIWNYVEGGRPIQSLAQAALSPTGNMTLLVRDLTRIKSLDGFFQDHLRSSGS